MSKRVWIKRGVSAMNDKHQVFAKYKDELGEDYYCTINTVADEHIVSEWELDNCVEASTAGRYAGNLKFTDQK